MADSFARRSVELDSPIRSFLGITPSNTVDIPQRPRAIYVSVAGDVSCIGDNGATVVFPLAAGWHPLSPVRIRASGTTATGLIGGW